VERPHPHLKVEMQISGFRCCHTQAFILVRKLHSSRHCGFCASWLGAAGRTHLIAPSERLGFPLQLCVFPCCKGQLWERHSFFPNIAVRWQRLPERERIEWFLRVLQTKVFSVLECKEGRFSKTDDGVLGLAIQNALVWHGEPGAE